MLSELDRRLEALRPLGIEVLRELERAAGRLGSLGFFAPAWEAGTPTLRRDPADGSMALVMEWRNAEGYRCGELVVNADGSLYAECDVLRPHPTDSRWFVEAITAWGRAGAINTEPRLLQAV
ncbi:hypothetical protein Thpro_021506 [Acidihalobacter prosperus]|uniref:Uncharacterized protein n=2 Tax=Acidihalobacter prosperus TaxID=160660 RepID=A0A1A6C3P2_9GAMM|nr:hypothetical protein Thpro_021506 [Acidihalobacter prosperus]